MQILVGKWKVSSSFKCLVKGLSYSVSSLRILLQEDSNKGSFDLVTGGYSIPDFWVSLAFGAVSYLFSSIGWSHSTLLSRSPHCNGYTQPKRDVLWQMFGFPFVILFHFLSILPFCISPLFYGGWFQGWNVSLFASFNYPTVWGSRFLWLEQPIRWGPSSNGYLVQLSLERWPAHSSFSAVQVAF